MKNNTRLDGIKNFVNQWSDCGYERGEAQPFWLNLLRVLFGVDDPERRIVFEHRINGKFIDAMIPSTHVLIEQKSRGHDLDAAFRQAKAYDNELPFDRKSRWIVCSDFQTFRIYDMNRRKPEPEIIRLLELPKEYHRLNFLLDLQNEHIQRELELSLRAGEIVGNLYDAFAKSYVDPESPEATDSLNKLCVRLVFCLYAEDAGIFKKNQLHDYLNKFPTEHLRIALINLFEVLATPDEQRDPYIEDTLAEFPYVNGGLFVDEKIEIPKFTAAARFHLLVEAEGFNWAGISPTIFGALFESTLNPSTRRSGGMHYTSIENIRKVIDPLFLDELRAEFHKCKTRRQLLDFQDKLASLKFFDPACGSGNFLTETYLCLRRLENEVLKRLFGAKIKLGDIENPIKVSIEQFYGVEINDFAVAVAQTAMWIAESQMMRETGEIVHRELDFLPLKTAAHIVRGNALRLDWKKLVPRGLNYIMGNPPFSGARLMTAENKSDLHHVFDGWKNVGNLDFVCCWFKRAAEFIVDTSIRCGFVATNSIAQGELIGLMWKPIFVNQNIHIDFAWRTFKWSNEIKDSASVHCVIVGFSHAPNRKPKLIFDGEKKIVAKNINAYLLDAPDFFVERRTTPICNVPTIMIGNRPTDDGNYLFTAEEAEEFLQREPRAKKFIRQLIGGEEFVKGKLRYCLWLKDATPDEIRSMPQVRKRVENVRKFRSTSASADNRKDAVRPALFARTPQPVGVDYIAVPQVSSERRRYIPMGFICGDIIASNLIQIIPNATLHEFGVLESIVHMAWMRVVCGRLGNGYRYSASLVYNNFPWATPTETRRAAIERSAQKILDARTLYPNSGLAALYDEATMPLELRKAHAENDRAVLDAYGFDRSLDESEIVARLIQLYRTLIAPRASGANDAAGGNS